MTTIIKPCRVPWAISPTMSGLTLSHEEDDHSPQVTVVLGGRRLTPNNRRDDRRIELRFLTAAHVRAAPKGDGEDIDSSGFVVEGGYEESFGDYLEWWDRTWRETGECPESGFYVATTSPWLTSARLMYGDSPKHYVVVGRDNYIEVIAERYEWREWLWPSGPRENHRDDASVAFSGGGTE